MQRKLWLSLFMLFALCIAMPAHLPAATVQFSKTLTPYLDCDTPQATVDLNNDGRADIISISQCPYGRIPVFFTRLSTGNGQYSTTEQSYTLPGSDTNFPYGFFFGDFNNDGWADVGVLGNALYLYLNDGKGNLVLKSTLNVVPSGPVAVADFNNDRNIDLAYVAAGQLHILFGNGKAGFTAGPVTAVNYDGGAPLLVGDFDGDGIADLAFGDLVNYTAPTVLYGDNTGHFVPKTITTLFGYLMTGDVNSDGRTDLIIIPGGPASAPVARYIGVYYGNAARTFANHTTIPTKGSPYSVALADVDGNGLKDLVVSEFVNSNYDIDSVGVRTRNPDSSYNAEQTIFTPNATELLNGGVALGPWTVSADQNSKPDLVVGACADSECLGTNYYTLLNTTTGSFPACAPPKAFEGINVCSPGTSSSSPVAFHVGAAGQVPMRKVEVWVDGVKKVEQLDGFANYSFLDSNISMNPGSHKVTIFAAGWDNWLEQKTFTLNLK